MKFTKKIVSFLLAMVLAVSGTFFVNLKAEAFDRISTCEFGFSDSPMGQHVPQAITGRDYYFYYKIFDSNTGDPFNSYSGSTNYNVRLTIYNPDNYPIVSYTYNNRDADCVGAYFDRSELWYWAEIEIYGDVEAYSWTSIYCQPADLRADIWTSDAIMGNHKQYFDRNEFCYLNYNLIDINSGYRLDELLPSLNYTVEESIVSPSNKVLQRYTYNNDNNFIGASLSSRGTYTAKIVLRGDINAEFSTNAYAKYYTKDETYSFINTYSSFLPITYILNKSVKGKYYMEDSHFSVLEQRIRAACSKKESADNYVASMTAYRNSEWNGSCYGMSITTLLDKFNMVAVNENFSSSDTINGIRNINLFNKEARSVINYYQISQSLSFADPFNYSYSKNSSLWSTGLKNVVSAVRSNNLIPFNFFWEELNDKNEVVTVGHAIVLQSLVVREDGSFHLLAYDPNFPGGTTIVEIDKNYKTCKFFSVDENCYIYTTDPTRIEYASNFSKLDKIDIDGSNNVFTQSESTEDLPTQISFDLIGNVTVVNEEGETLVWDGTEFSGDMTVLSQNYSFGSGNVDGISVARINIDVEDSSSFTFIADCDDMNISVIGKNIFASVKSSKAEAVVVAQNEGVHILGSDTTSEVFMTTGNNADVIHIGSLDAKDIVSITYANAGVHITGATNDNCEITTYFDNNENKCYEVVPNCESFLISCNTNNNTIGIWGSNDEINYDIDIEYTEVISIEDAEIVEDTVELICGESKELNYTIFPSNAAGDTCWMSIDPEVAVVDENGKVTAVGIGETTIVALSPEGDIFDECKIISDAPALSEIVAEPKEIILSVDETKNISVTPIPEKAELKDLSWSSSDPDIATVDSDGNVTAKKAGTVTISVKTADGKCTAQIDVTVSPVEVTGIIIAEANIAILKGEIKQIKAETLPINATNKSLIWSSNNEAVAKVDENGNVSGISCGEALITAKSVEGEYSATCKVTVVEPSFDGTFAIKSPSTTTVNYGDTLVLHADFGETQIPEGYRIEWGVEGSGVSINPSEDGFTCEVTSIQKGKVKVTAQIVDDDGEILLNAKGEELSVSQELTSNVTFWQKIVSFFKNLFRIPRIILQAK